MSGELILACLAAVSAHGKTFPPGWNGLAKTPPMGWRSWNAFGNRINQETMLQAAEALVARNRTVAGESGKVSLCDVGYCSVGVDEGWEDCTAGVAPSRQHDASGLPTIDASFPDMGAMVRKLHDLGLSAGWYLNGCKCGERVELPKNYEGDITALHQFGFDVCERPHRRASCAPSHATLARLQARQSSSKLPSRGRSGS